MNAIVQIVEVSKIACEKKKLIYEEIWKFRNYSDTTFHQRFNFKEMDFLSGYFI